MRPCNRHLPARAVIIAMLCLAFTFTGSAGALTPTIVIDADTGRVLQHQDSRRRWYPASLAKVMTLYLVFERLEAGGLADDQLLEVSSHAAAQPAVRLGLRNRERISVRDAILAIVTLSANDAAVVLAEAVAGSEPAFILRMDAKARQLGLQSTRFANATGLPGPDQFTTARDMAVLGRALLQSFPGRYQLFSTHAFSFRGRTFINRNALLRQYEGADGLKTGFTCGAGYNLLASGVRDGRRAIGVVLGSRSRGERLRRMTALLDAAFANAQWHPERRYVDDRTAGAIAPPANLMGPPTALPHGECARTAASANQPADPNARWGLLFGVFGDQAAARAAVREARGRLEGVVDGGRELLLSRDFGQGKSWKALLVGYRPDDAGRACQHLLADQRSCVAQSPQVLDAPGYAVR